jgi:hypothetical protein
VGWLPVSRAAKIRAALLHADQLDQAWMRKVPEDDRRYAPWMPFSNDAFLALALAALREAPGDPPSFFEIGCGIGSKMMLAHDVLGFSVSGIERVTELAVQAAQLGYDAEIGDAADYGGYGKHDIVWFNRACRDPVLQAQLEARVWENMRPGAVAMCANLEAPPPGWIVVDQDMDHVCRGAWQKPLPG